MPQVAEIVQCHPEHRYRMIRQAQAEGRKVPGLIELPAVTSRQRGRRFYRFVTAAFLGSLEAA